MPNYEGLSPEQKKRQQAAHEKISGDFKSATRGEVRTPDARLSNNHRTGTTIIFVLDLETSTRHVNTAAERRRIEFVEKQARRIAAKQHVKVDRSQQKGALMKEFTRSRGKGIKKEFNEL
jgi:hypothetical protein